VSSKQEHVERILAAVEERGGYRPDEGRTDAETRSLWAAYVVDVLSEYLDEIAQLRERVDHLQTHRHMTLNGKTWPPDTPITDETPEKTPTSPSETPDP
jgi:hypothetical protein